MKSLLRLLPLTIPVWLPAADFHDPNADRAALPKVPVGFEISFFAKEPLVRQPCSMAFDARGRLCVGMGPQYRNPKPDTPGDSVVLVLDDDGDGRADRTRVFATRFNAIQGLAWHGRDLWVANAPDLTVVRDLDGDDEADEYVRIYTDLGNLEHGLHGLNWAPDGRLYLSKGNSKGLTQPGRVAPKAFRDLWGVRAPVGTPDLPPPQTFRKGEYRKAYHDPADDWGLEGGVLRCEDGGTGLEIVSRGMRNPWDMTFDGGFNALVTDNDQNSGDRVFLSFQGAHFGWNHPWSAHWGTPPHPPTAPVSGPLHEGSYTGIVFGDSPAFPGSHRQVFFVNDWLRKATFVWRPVWDGALLKPAGGDWEPFIDGGRSLFRPTDLEIGPDGALWILGWSAGYGAEYRDGQMTSEGRVFRVTATGRKPAPALASRRARPMSDRTPTELIEDLDGLLPVWRIDAQDELVRRGDTVRPALLAALKKRPPSETRETWLLWTLGRGPLADRSRDEILLQKLRMPDTGLNRRIQCARILADRTRRRGTGAALPEAVVSLLEHAEPRLRFEAVQAIGLCRQTSTRDALLRALATESDRVTAYAGWQALRRITPGDILESLLADPRPGVRRSALLALLEDQALVDGQVRPLAADPDPSVREIAALWLQKSGAGAGSVEVRGRPLEAVLSGGKAHEPVLLPVRSTSTTLDQALAALDSGSAERGARWFHAPGGAGCAQCHRFNGQGNAFGPELTAIADRAPVRHLVQSLLEPNAVITEGFQLLTVQTRDAEHSGILLEESGLSVTLGLATGERVVIPKSKIVDRTTEKTSAMPAFDTVLGPAEVADLVAYLRSRPAPAASTPATATLPAATSGFGFEDTEGRLRIRRNGQPLAEFVYRDDRILRPHFANLHALDGSRVTRRQPPVSGQDATDHDTMHPGLWLGFGDISGVDFWRNRGRIDHVAFVDSPSVQEGTLRFATESRLRGPDGTTLGAMTNRFTIQPGDGLWMLTWEAVLVPAGTELVLGDQEEMGFAARVATPLTEKIGGRILSSTGRVSAQQTWGQAADWCDYARAVEGRSTGITLMADPSNFRPSWWHNRDYGVFVANPFGREAMKQGAKSAVVVKPGSPLRLRFGAVLHSGPAEPPFDPTAAYLRFRNRSTP